MPTPAIAGRCATVLVLEPGTYAWCACGLSKNQPFCAGSHAGAGFEPREFEVKETTRLALCACKHTRNPPMCDSSHKYLPDPGAGGGA